MLINESYSPPGMFPKFPLPGPSQTQISHVLAGVGLLPGIVCPLYLSLSMSWWLLQPGLLHILFLVVPVGAAAWTSLAYSQPQYPQMSERELCWFTDMVNTRINMNQAQNDSHCELLLLQQCNTCLGTRQASCLQLGTSLFIFFPPLRYTSASRTLHLLLLLPPVLFPLILKSHSITSVGSMSVRPSQLPI